MLLRHLSAPVDGGDPKRAQTELILLPKKTINLVSGMNKQLLAVLLLLALALLAKEDETNAKKPA